MGRDKKGEGREKQSSVQSYSESIIFHLAFLKYITEQGHEGKTLKNGFSKAGFVEEL